jgi:hypothetical protein
MAGPGLNAPFHRQDSVVFCGAACAQSVLSSLYPGDSLFEQDKLAGEIGNNSTSDLAVPWYSGPDGLRWALSRYQPSRQEYSFQVAASATEEKLSRLIVWALYSTGKRVPQIALTYGMRHWLLVYDYDIEGDPKGPDDSSYEIRGFYVRDSSPYVTYPARLTPHEYDDGCGEGQGRGLKFQHISYRTWRTVYMTGVPRDTPSRWAGKFIAVCNISVSDLASAKLNEYSVSTVVRRAVLRSRMTKKAQEDQEVRAKEGAVKGIKGYNLLIREPWDKIAAELQTQEIRPGDPVLVHPKMPGYEEYYLVPMERVLQGERRPVVVLVNAYTGEYLESAAMPSVQANVVPTLMWEKWRDEIWEDMRREAKAGTLEKDRVAFASIDEYVRRAKASGVETPPCQWLPCPHCFSRFLPVFIVGGIESNHLHFRIDGKRLPGMHSHDLHDVWGL